MENYDPRRRQDEERQQERSEDRGRDRDSWLRGERSHEDDRPRRAERSSLDYGREARPDDRQERREDRGYGEARGAERTRFSPDWSREGAEPRYSDDPYYSRNRELGSDEGVRRGRSEGPASNDWPFERTGREFQRSREQEEGSHYRGYYSRSATPFSYPGATGYLYSESVTLQGPYAGRGPKGYKRSDQQIIEDACQRLERDGEIDASEIEVTAEEGVIRLRGTVSDRRTKRRAEDCVESIYGVRDVMNELRVLQRGSEQTQDALGSRAAAGGRESQASHSAQGSQGSLGSAPSTPGMRPGTGEQTGDDKRTPKH